MNRNKEAIVEILLKREGIELAQGTSAIVGRSVDTAIQDEFGHTAFNGGDVHIDMWGAGPFELTVDGETFQFEDSDRFGPIHCEDGEPSGYQFCTKSKFWPAWQDWKDRGRPVAEDGKTCI